MGVYSNEGIFLKNILNYCIVDKLKEIIKLEEKTNDLYYKSSPWKTCNFNEYSLPIAFLRHINEGYLSLEDGDNEQGKFANELTSFDEGVELVEKT